MQKKGVVHRDLSLENVLIHDDRCVIVDLGMALRVPFVDPDNEHVLADASAGTMRRLIQAQGVGGRWTYIAPEVVSSEDHFDGYAVDLWAAGVILFILLVGRSPFEMAVETDRYYSTFSSGGLKETLRHWDVPISDEACDLLQGMMWNNPSDRFNLAQIASHPWVAGRSGRPASKSISGENALPKTSITKALQQSRGTMHASKAMATAYHKSSQVLRGAIRI